MDNKIWKNFELKNMTAMLIVIMLLSVIIYSVIYNQHQNVLIGHLRSNAVNVHRYAQETLDERSFYNLNNREDENKELYIDAHEQFDEIRRIANILYLYTAKMNENGEYIYVIDGFDSNAEDFRHIGDPIEDEIIPLLEQCLNGDEVLGNKILNTEWGIVYVAYFPFYDSHGNIIGAIGMEFDCEELYKSNVYTRTATIFILLIISFVFMVSSFFIIRGVTKRTKLVFSKLEKQKSDAEEHAKLMLDSGPMCCFLWDEDGNLIDCNQAAIYLFGYKDKKELKRKWLKECTPEFQPNGHLSSETGIFYRRKAIEKSKITFSWMHQTSNGAPLPLEVDLVCVKRNEGFIIVQYMRDLRKEKYIQQKLRDSAERERKLEIQKEAAQIANDAKTQFLANMSHEIRTPMHVITGMADLLLSENLEYRQHRYALDIKTSAISLLTIVNDILDISHIQSGKLNLMPVHYNFKEFIDNIISVAKYLINDKTYASKRDKSLLFNYEIDENIPRHLYGDDVRLRQIFLNLLSNAIKYTEDGTVSMKINLRETQTDEREIFAVISDTGRGIPEKDIPNLFAAFERADQANTRNLQGTGLGLAITKSLLKMMGGKVWCESVYGKGSSFYFTIPVEEGDASLVARKEESTPVYAPDAKVLVVDDKELNLNVMQGMLRQCDIIADGALSGERAIEMAKNKLYDLIFMDHMMPNMDGTETTRVLRKEGFSMPIVALTANAISGAREMMLKSGMDDFLSKPVDKSELYRVLKEWLPEEKISDTHVARKVDGGEDKVDSDGDYESSRVLFAQIEELSVETGLATSSGSWRDYQGTLQILARESVKSVSALREFLKNCDMKSFCTEAHGIKGSLALAGATALSAKARELENASSNEDIQFCADNLEEFTERLEKLGNDLKNVFGELEKIEKSKNADCKIVISPELREIFARLTEAIDNMSLEEIFSDIDTLSEMEFKGKLADEIQHLTEALQIMNYDSAKDIISRLT